jgi:hypothetical protein
MLIIENDKNHYKTHGWALIKNIIPLKVISEIREKGIYLRNWVDERLGQPSKYGSPTYWRGLGCAGMYDEYLMKFYKSDLMFQVASELLDTEEIWLFNDQIVIKLPKDNFGFEPHYDNQFGGENKSKLIHTVNIGVVLDDYDDQNGTLEMFNELDQKWIKIYPKKGDLVAINGNTLHKSSPNMSDNARGLYACVYSEKQINLDNYYKEKFKETFPIDNLI